MAAHDDVRSTTHSAGQEQPSVSFLRDGFVFDAPRLFRQRHELMTDAVRWLKFGPILTGVTSE